MEPSVALLWWHQVCCRACAATSAALKSPADLHRGLSCSNIWLFYKLNPVASCMHLHNCRCFQEHLRMLLQSLRALCLAPGGSGSIWMYWNALVRSTWVFGRFVGGIWTELHFADIGMQQRCESNSESFENSSWTATGKDSRFGQQTN